MRRPSALVAHQWEEKIMTSPPSAAEAAQHVLQCDRRVIADHLVMCVAGCGSLLHAVPKQKDWMRRRFIPCSSRCSGVGVRRVNRELFFNPAVPGEAAFSALHPAGIIRCTAMRNIGCRRLGEQQPGMAVIRPEATHGLPASQRGHRRSDLCRPCIAKYARVAVNVDVGNALPRQNLPLDRLGLRLLEFTSRTNPVAHLRTVIDSRALPPRVWTIYVRL